jgi:hypothetical protein
MTTNFGGDELRVLVVYDSFIAGTRALALLRRVDGQCGAGGRLTHIMLRFDRLANPIIFELSVKAAQETEILVISTSEGMQLPQKVRAWIDQCLLRRETRPLALFASLDHDLMKPDDQACVGPYLAKMARGGKMEFFTDGGDQCEEANSRNFNVEGRAFDDGHAGSRPAEQHLRVRLHGSSRSHGSCKDRRRKFRGGR